MLWYLSGTIHYGLHLQPTPSDAKFSLRVYCESDWASDPDDRRSTSGLCVYFRPKLVACSAKKQTLVARSSAEAEYWGMAHATTTLLWIQSLLNDMQVPFSDPYIAMWQSLSSPLGSQSCLALSYKEHWAWHIFCSRENCIQVTCSKNMFQLQRRLQTYWQSHWALQHSPVYAPSLESSLPSSLKGEYWRVP